jgi:hypothetical protein
MSAERVAELRSLLETKKFPVVMDQADPIVEELSKLLKAHDKAAADAEAAEAASDDDAAKAEHEGQPTSDVSDDDTVEAPTEAPAEVEETSAEPEAIEKAVAENTAEESEEPEASASDAPEATPEAETAEVSEAEAAAESATENEESAEASTEVETGESADSAVETSPEEPEAEAAPAEETEAEAAPEAVAESEEAADVPAEAEAPAVAEAATEPIAEGDLIGAMRAAVQAYYNGRTAYYSAKKVAEEKNLALKQALLTEMQGLILQEENIGKAYNRISELHENWKEIGDVPRAKYPELQVEYSRLNEQFYYNINMYKELREHDFKRNSQHKLAIIKELDTVTALESVREMEKQIKKLQADWEAVGPTKQEEWEEIKDQYWTKVKVIYTKIRSFYDDRRGQQEVHLQAKRDLLEKTEALLVDLPENHKAWEAQTKLLLALQTAWKEIGYAGKGESEDIWKKFRTTCDGFFNRKKEFYNERRSEFDGFVQKKRALVEKAEKLKESNDWVNGSKALIQLQKEWKKIGNAGPRHEHKLWKQFRTACDFFFESRKVKEAEKEQVFVVNQEAKEALIKKIEAYKPDADAQKAIADLRAFSAEFNAAGHVPAAAKDAIYKAYKSALDGHYDSLDLEDGQKEKILFEARMEQMKGSPNAEKLLDEERAKVTRRIKELQDEVRQLDNNLGFFANSKGAEKIIADVHKKMDNFKDEIKGLEAKLNLMYE